MLPKDPYGSYIFVKTDSGLTSGELLAVEDDNVVYVMADGDRIVAIPDRNVLSARLVRFNPQAGVVAGLTMGGVLSTVSNGWALIFTAPAWILAGTAATAARSHEPEMELHKHNWKPMLPYARFPAGLPPGFLTTPPPPPTVVAREETPPAPPLPPEPLWRTDAHRFATHLGFGMGFHEAVHEDIEQSGFGFITSIDARLQGPLFISTRVSMAHREAAPELPFSDFAQSGESFDLALLIGIQGHEKRVRPGFGVGPAAVGASIGDVTDLDFAIAFQGEILVDVGQNIATGVMVSYNQNDKRNFYVVALGLRFMVW